MIRQKKEKRTIKGYGSAANRFDVTFFCDLFIFKEKHRQMLIQKHDMYIQYYTDKRQLVLILLRILLL
jgi:hypothetical protein